MPSDYIDGLAKLIESEQGLHLTGRVSDLDHLRWILTPPARNSKQDRAALNGLRRRVFTLASRSWSIAQAEGRWDESIKLVGIMWDLLLIHFAAWSVFSAKGTMDSRRKRLERIGAFINQQLNPLPVA